MNETDTGSTITINGIEIPTEAISDAITAFAQTIQASPSLTVRNFGQVLESVATGFNAGSEFGANPTNLIRTFGEIALGTSISFTAGVAAVPLASGLAAFLATSLVGFGIGTAVAAPLGAAIAIGVIAVSIIVISDNLTEFLVDNTVFEDLIIPTLDFLLEVLEEFPGVLSPVLGVLDLFDTIASFVDPLAIDLDGDGVNTTSVGESGVTFDLDNNGTEEGTGWFEAEDGILFHDWKGGTDENGNPVGDGEAQDRSELFENFEQLSRHDLNGDGILDARDVAPQATTDTNGDGIIDASDVVLPDEDTNGDGVIDVNDISPFAQDTNGDGIISEDEITQPTITGDFDGDGTTETINVGWDQIDVWIDANQNGNVDEGELHSLEELGITSIDLDATELDVEDNGNIINSESTVTLEDGSTAVINGVSFNRDTINQSYEQQIANLDLSPEYLGTRLDVFTMPQMQGSGNVPHLLIAGLSDDGVLEAWRAVSNYAGNDLTEFTRLVEDLLIEWSGGNDAGFEYNGFAGPQIIHAMEQFIGIELPLDVDNFVRAEAVADTWEGFVASMAVRFLVQSQNLNPDGNATYDFAADRFTGDLTSLIDDLGEQFNDPNVTAAKQQTIRNLLESVYSSTVAEGDGQSLAAASQVEGILTAQNLVQDTLATFNDEFQVGYADGENFPVIESGGTGGGDSSGSGSTVYYPPGFDYGTTDGDILSVSQIEQTAGAPGRVSVWDGEDAYLFGGGGNDTFIVGDALRAPGDPVEFTDSEGTGSSSGNEGIASLEQVYSSGGFGLGSETASQTLVDNLNDEGGSRLYIGFAEELEFSREGHQLIISNVNTGATVLVQNQFLSSTFGVSEIVFRGELNINSRLLADIAAEFENFDLLPTEDGGGVLTEAQFARLAWVRGTDESDLLTGTGDDETFSGGLRNDVISGGAGSDTYVYASGDGNDTIIDNGVFGGTDVLFFEDVISTDVSFSRTGDSLLVEVLSTGQVITIEDHFADSGVGGGIEQFDFSDGVILNREQIDAIASFNGDQLQNTIIGSPEDDVFNGGQGNDVFVGRSGSDTYVYASGDGNDTIVENFAVGSDGIDTLQLVDLNRNQVELRRTTDTLFVVDLLTGQTINVPLQFSQEVNNFGLEQIIFADGTIVTRGEFASEAVFVGTDLNDTIVGTSADETFDAGEGDDQVNGGTGSDTYRYASGDGNDTIIDTSVFGDLDTDTFQLVDLNASDLELRRIGEDLVIVNTLSGEQISVTGQFDGLNRGLETIEFADGSAFDRTQIQDQAIFYGTSGNDTIAGDLGGNIIQGLTGNDTLQGSGGSDVYVYASGDGSDTIDDHHSADSGDTDRLILTDLTSGQIAISASGGDLKITDLLTGSVITSLNNADSANAGNGLEEIEFADGEIWNRADIIAQVEASQQTDDTFVFADTGSLQNYEGGGGSDTVDFSDFGSAVWVDLTYNGAEAWTRDGTNVSSGSWRAIANLDEVENIIGTDFDDEITGDSSDNIFTALAGNDLIDGGSGNDTVILAGSAEDYTVSTGSGNVQTITHIASGETNQLSNIETIIYDPSIVYNFESEDDTFIYVDTGSLQQFSGGAGIDTADFSTFGSAVWVDMNYNGADAWTRDGENVTSGSWRSIANFDSIENVIGTDFDDEIIANASNNTLTGGMGDDLLTGGGGEDVFRFDVQNFGADTITDFEDGVDLIDLTGVAQTFSDVTIVQNGANTEISILGDTDNMITLSNVDASQITQDDFVI